MNSQLVHTGSNHLQLEMSLVPGLGWQQEGPVKQKVPDKYLT